MNMSNSSARSARPMQWALLVAVALAATGCASFSRKETGAAIGAAGGATLGAVIGKNTGSTARGAIIGAVVGGTAGAIIGHQMDQQAKELTLEIPGAVVERVGEGIQITFASGLLYDFDSAAIRADAGQNLRNLANSLKKYPNTELLIVGHTDALGSTAYNQDLSLRRAVSASEFLALQGVGSGRMHTAGKGEGEALASNETEAGRQLNRRIEVAIYAGARTDAAATDNSSTPASASAAPVTAVNSAYGTGTGPRIASSDVAAAWQMNSSDFTLLQNDGRRLHAGSNVALMGTGAAAVLVGLLVGGDGGTFIALGGGVVGLFGLYRYLR